MEKSYEIEKTSVGGEFIECKIDFFAEKMNIDEETLNMSDGCKFKVRRGACFCKL